MDVPMELSRVLITELGDQQVIFLREKQGGRTFPILIGTAEALAIDRRIKGQAPPRPMTHDLLANVIECMGGRLERIVIDDLRDHTFFAKLHVRRDGEVIVIDARPSDAIALGAAFQTPIFVAEKVLNEVCREPATAEERVDLLRQRLASLHEKIQEVTRRLADPNFQTMAPEPVIAEHRRQLGEMQAEYDAIDRVLKKLPGL